MKKDWNAAPDTLRPWLLGAGWVDVVVVACIAGVVASMLVVFRNVDFARTYHTGFEPYSLALLYALIGAFGVLRLVRRPKRRWLTAVLTAVSVASMATMVWLDVNNVVVEYNRWIRRGMPERPF